MRCNSSSEPRTDNMWTRQENINGGSTVVESWSG